MRFKMKLKFYKKIIHFAFKYIARDTLYAELRIQNHLQISIIAFHISMISELSLTTAKFLMVSNQL